MGGKRKGFLLVRETSKGGGVAMSADTCPGLSTGPLLPGGQWLVLGSLAETEHFRSKIFTWGGVVRREEEGGVRERG